MATVVGGASYGLYTLAQRYVKPLIAPPTPPQLEQDKTAVDEQFNKAFALLDTLSSDTTALKEAEEQRTQRLDKTISDVESIVTELKAANTKREDDARRMEAELKTMKDSLPRAIDSVRDGSEKQLKELSSELGSLKLLMSNRFGGSAPSSSNFGAAGARPQPTPQPVPQPQADSASALRSGTSTPSTELAPGSSSNATGANASGTVPSFATPSVPSYAASASVAARPKPSTSFGTSGGKASIPAWQMAAQNKLNSTTNTNGTSSTPTDGADAVAALSAS